MLHTFNLHVFSLSTWLGIRQFCWDVTYHFHATEQMCLVDDMDLLFLHLGFRLMTLQLHYVDSINLVAISLIASCCQITFNCFYQCIINAGLDNSAFGGH